MTSLLFIEDDDSIRLADLVALVLEREPQSETDRVIVFDEQQGRHVDSLTDSPVPR